MNERKAHAPRHIKCLPHCWQKEEQRNQQAEGKSLSWIQYPPYWESPSFLFPFLSFLAQLQAVRKGPQPLETDKERELQHLSIHFLFITLLTFLPKELLLSYSPTISTKYSSSSTPAVFLLLHTLTWFVHVSFSQGGIGWTEVRELNLAHTPDEMQQPVKHST